MTYFCIDVYFEICQLILFPIGLVYVTFVAV